MSAYFLACRPRSQFPVGRRPKVGIGFVGRIARASHRNQNLPVEFDEAKNLVWKVVIPGLGNSSPVVWDNQLFIQTAAADGSTPHSPLPRYKNGHYDLGQATLASKPSRRHHHAKNTLASATPATDGKAVYIATWDGRNVILCRVDDEGRAAFGNKTSANSSASTAPAPRPFFIATKFYFAFDSDVKAAAFCFDKASGKPLWSASRAKPRSIIPRRYASPRILEKGANGVELIITNSTAITSYNPDTGSRNWNWTWMGAASQVAFALVAGSAHCTSATCSFACSGTSNGPSNSRA